MLFGSLAFAVMGTLAHALRLRCDWQVIALARSLGPLLLTLVLSWSAGVRLVWFRPRTLWLRSIAGSVSLVCTFFALTRLPVSDVFTLTNTFPIWVAVLSWPVLGERPSWRVWLCVALGVLGVVLIQQPHLAEGNGAALVALVSSVASAVAMIGLHRLDGIDARAIVVHFSAVSLLFSGSACLVCAHAPDLPGLPDDAALWMLLGVGVMATAGQLFLTKAFRAGAPAKVSVVALSQILFALALERVLWQRPFDPLMLLGVSLVAAPTAWLLARQA